LYACLQCVVVRSVRPKRLLQVSALVLLISTTCILAFAYRTIGRLFVSDSGFIGYGIIVLFGSGGWCGLYTFLGPATADRSATAHMLVFLHENSGSVK